jgi:hypothetical protein
VYVGNKERKSGIKARKKSFPIQFHRAFSKSSNENNAVCQCVAKSEICGITATTKADIGDETH